MAYDPMEMVALRAGGNRRALQVGHEEAAIGSASGSAVQPHERAGEVGRREGAEILDPFADSNCLMATEH